VEVDVLPFAPPRYSIAFQSVLVALFLNFALNASAFAQKPDVSALETAFQRISGAARGRVGIALIHLESGTTIDVRGHERFPMASIVKLPIAIEVLQQVAEGKLTLDRAVWLAPNDIRPCCTIERRHPKGGVSRPVIELLELAIVESDNTAADALLKLVGGVDVVERRLRGMGFRLMNVDRTEGQLLLDMAGVTNAPPPEQWTIEIQRKLLADSDRESVTRGRAHYLVDERDTATPYETAQLLGRLQLGDLLPRSQTDLLMGLLLQTKTGPRRIKGRLPPDTLVAHKTGTTAAVINDAGIIMLPPGSKIGGRVVLVVYIAGGASIGAMERTVAQIGAATFEFFTGRTVPQRPVQRRRRR
jgi:beta-lactamase class A